MDFYVDDDYTEIEISNDVKCFDNFLYESDYRKMNEILKNKFLNKSTVEKNGINIWHSSVGYHPYTTTHYSMSLVDPFFHEYIVSRISDAVGIEFTAIRIYTSLQKFGEFGNFHIDDGNIDAYTFTLYTCFTLNPLNGSNNFLEECHINFFNKSIYKEVLNKSDSKLCNKINNGCNEHKNIKKTMLQQTCDRLNQYNHDGHFTILLPQSNALKTIPFVVNRGVFFPSRYVHNGGTFNQTQQFTRVVVSFKLLKKKHI